MSAQPETALDLARLLAEHRIDLDLARRRLEEGRAAGRADLPARFGPFVTVSGLLGSGAPELARSLGARLHWPALDHELVDAVALELGRAGHSPRLLDEESSNWIRDLFGDLMANEVASQDTYAQHVAHVVRLFAVHGRVILVGHGAPFFLPRRHGLRVHLVAPPEQRIGRVASDRGVDRQQAEALVERQDADHRRFLTRTFRLDGRDPADYDLVLNASSFSTPELTEIVLTACRHRALLDPGGDVER